MQTLISRFLILSFLMSSVLAQASEPTLSKAQALSVAQESQIPAVLVESAVSVWNDSFNAKVLSVYQGSAVAPFFHYVMIFDVTPRDGGDYGSFRTFELPYRSNHEVKDLKVVTLSKSQGSVQFVTAVPTYNSKTGQFNAVKTRVFVNFGMDTQGHVISPVTVKTFPMN